MNVRPFVFADESRVIAMFRAAFAGFPWYQSWSDEDAARVWGEHASRPGFECLVAVDGEQTVAATWHDAPSLDDLARERGSDLADFARAVVSDGPVVWVRETVCDPAHQGRGITGRLKTLALVHLRGRYPGGILLTRMRDDNVGIVRVNQRLGFQKTGIRVASRAYPGLMHDYWFLRV